MVILLHGWQLHNENFNGERKIKRSSSLIDFNWMNQKLRLFSRRGITSIIAQSD